MIRRIIILAAVTVLAGCTAPPRSVTSAGRVVAQANQMGGYLGQPGWSPTEAQMAACEAAIARALIGTRHDLANYYVLLGGVIRNGTRQIVGCAADKRVVGTQFLQPPAEDTIYMGTYGGGEAFFRFEYDAERGILVEFQFNASL